MNTNRRTRPTGAPASYLGRPASRWLDAVERGRTRSAARAGSPPDGIARAA